METITINSLAIGAAIGLVLGFVITKIINKSKGSSIVKDAERTAKNRVRAAHKEAESIKKDKILQAKERFIELKSEHEKVIQNREKKVVDIEPRKIRLGDMVHYYKTPEYNERLEKVFNPEEKDEIKSRKMFVVFNLIMKDKWLEFISQIIYRKIENKFKKVKN